MLQVDMEVQGRRNVLVLAFTSSGDVVWVIVALTGFQEISGKLI
jgi:hypothetical protein